MQFASSLYKGGELIAASGANYSASGELGLICPFCKESVFWVKAHLRGMSNIPASWRHYKIGLQSSYCENRALSKEGKAELKALQRTAHNQRLKLFNRRFWEIFAYEKAIPPSFRAMCIRIVGEDVLQKMVKHCHDRWDVPAILAALPSKIAFRMDNPEIRDALINHPAARLASQDELEDLIEKYAQTKFSILRLKILSEAIAWLGTKSAYLSFEKLICLSFLDCLEVTAPPIHSQTVTEMALVSLTLTDWEEAIAHLEDKSRAIGFGNLLAIQR